MVPMPEADCWLHPGVEVGRSPIAGRGLFARVLIPMGAVVSRLGGRLVSGAELARLLAQAQAGPAGRYVDSIAVVDDWHLVLPPGRASGLGNHSCDPNTWWAGPYTLVARRAIRPGEEVTNDYATSTVNPDFTMSCRCGTPLCRATVTGTDWRRPELQDRYGAHWTPAPLALIKADTGDQHAR